LDQPTEVRSKLVVRRTAVGGVSGASEDVDGAVLDQLYRAFFVRLVRRVTWRYGLSKEDAREVVHDAFVLALVKLNVDGNPRSWIYAVVDRLAANWKRKENRHAELLARWGGRPAPAEEQSTDEEGG
jgi:DNA-directed RNA polymerase specialized sigma24 family protein